MFSVSIMGMFVYKEVASNDTIISSSSMGTFLKQLKNVLAVMQTHHFCVRKGIWFSSFIHTRSLLVPYAYVSIETIDCILLSSFELKSILLISSVKICLSLLNLCWVFNIDLLEDYLLQFCFYLNGLFYFQFELFLNSF